MGHPARKQQAADRGAGRTATARLRLVPPVAKPPQAAPARVEAACTSAFRVVALVLMALTLFGLGRVYLSARVAEASIDASRLRQTIKVETRVADRLELDKSMLVMPSRIESIAAGALRMAPAAPARYLPLPDAGTARTGTGGSVQGATAARRASLPLAGLAGAALDVTEREARALLVGDAGLAQTP